MKKSDFLDLKQKKIGKQIASNIIDLIGNTPIIHLQRIVPKTSADIYAKLEYFNPAGSIKDRVAFHLIQKGEELGYITSETVIIEPTSGNTGIGLAMICASKGYRCIIVLPDSMSLERIFLLKRFGAEVVLTPSKSGLEGALKRVEEIAKKEKDSFIPRQFENVWNPQIHEEETGKEILESMSGSLNAFVAGVGTGGTITGVGRTLKNHDQLIQIIAVEPKNSPILSLGRTGVHKIQGIGAGFVPKVLDKSLIDEIICVSDREAFVMMNKLSSEEGILAGISSGAAMVAALKIAKKLRKGKKVVVVFSDTGERYLSTQQYFEF